MNVLLENLNPQQLHAVTAPAKSMLVLAGAGSGKTRVLTTRIAWLIQTKQAHPLQVMAVTFTNKAANEMRQRLANLLDIPFGQMWIGTFHGLSRRLLQAHHQAVGLIRDFQILDMSDQLSLIKRLMKTLHIDEDKFPPRDLARYINTAKEAGLRPSTVEVFNVYLQIQRDFYQAYQNQCQRESLVDFAELLLRSYELLSQNTSIREHYRSRFQIILVDEFQDTNHLQYQWIKLLKGTSTSIFAVGDDDQSIYTFRGARVSNMNDFLQDFDVQEVIKLEQNYRSHAQILNVANAVISHNKERLGKNLWTNATHGERVKIFNLETDVEEANFILHKIKDLNQKHGIALQDIAILYRTNAQSRIIEHALFTDGLAYQVYGGLRFYDREEIKHVLAYLRLLNNADDDSALLRIINIPARGIGAKGIAQLSSMADSRSLWKACLHSTQRNIMEFVQLIERLRPKIEQLTLEKLIDTVMQETGLLQLYEDKQEIDKIENLKELVSSAGSFIQQTEEGNLGDFLNMTSLEAGEHGTKDSGVKLMTIHSAKGLEFKVVFISGLEEGLFPHERTNDFSLTDKDLEEERRLFYVAITRAQAHLYLTYAERRMIYGNPRYHLPSCFLDEIPDKLVERAYRNTSSFFSQQSRISHQPSQQITEDTLWKLGANVRHTKFGVGTVLAYEGGTNDRRIQINFGKQGVKWLALEYAKLENA